MTIIIHDINIDTVAVVRELGKRRSSNINKSVESSMSQADDWDQNDFDELHPTSKENKGGAKGKNNSNTVALIESRFLMYDLIKITSRKSSSKIITFYFRIPLHQDYNTQQLEHNLIQQLDQRPTIKYQFAFKRKVISSILLIKYFSRITEKFQLVSNLRRRTTPSSALQM